MKLLYPTLKNYLLAFAMLLTLASYAQDKTFASAKVSSQSSVTYDRSKVSDPVVKVISRSDRHVSIAWPAYSGDVSQYILERSIDGKRFVELTAVVTVMSNEDPYYEFTDRFKSSYTGPLFYRVRVEGLDGGVLYTPVTILKAVSELH
jgi:hypothetical protein